MFYISMRHCVTDTGTKLPHLDVVIKQAAVHIPCSSKQTTSHDTGKPVNTNRMGHTI